MITGTLFHACMIGLFVFYFDWGFTGVVWATALMFVARCAMNVGQVMFLDDIRSTMTSISSLGKLLETSDL